MIPLSRARELLQAHTPTLPPVSRRVGPDLWGHILACEVHSTRAVPPFPASIVDGYALPRLETGEYTITDTSTAGGPTPTPLTHHAARISTGARVPPGTAAIVMVEHTRLLDTRTDADGRTDEARVLVLDGVRAASDLLRPAGTDMAAGQLILPRGALVAPFSGIPGVLASAGVEHCLVHRKPVVGILSTGNEIAAASSAPAYAILDANRPNLECALRGAGFEVVDLGVVRDEYVPPRIA